LADLKSTVTSEKNISEVGFRTRRVGVGHTGATFLGGHSLLDLNRVVGLFVCLTLPYSNTSDNSRGYYLVLALNLDLFFFLYNENLPERHEL
jgi:hypothetical protein